MKIVSINKCLIAVALVSFSLVGSLCADDKISLKDHAKVLTTEVFDLNSDGDIVGRTVTTDTTIALRSKVVEVHGVDSNGLEYVASRKTETYDSLRPGAQPNKIIVEKALEPGDELIVTAVTTIVKNGAGTITTCQGLDKKTGELVISKRVVTGVDDEGRFVTTIESRSKDGSLNVIKTTVKSSD